MSAIMEQLGFTRIAGKLYRTSKLREEAERRLKVFDRPDIVERFEQFGEVQRRRRTEDRVQLLKFAYLAGLKNWTRSSVRLLRCT